MGKTLQKMELRSWAPDGETERNRKTRRGHSGEVGLWQGEKMDYKLITKKHLLLYLSVPK